MAVNKGDLISASSFNSLVTQYDKFWSDTYTTSAWTDSDKSNHGYGWGQASVEPTVNAQTIIEAAQWNRLLAQVNAGLYHTDDDVSQLLTLYAPGTPIFQTAYNNVENTITAFDAIKFNGYANAMIDLIHSNEGEQWEDYTDTIVKYTWPTYTDARYFFNSGGDITFDLDAEGGTSGYDAWNYAFNACGEIIFSADTMGITGATTRFVFVEGFYELTNTEQLLITVSIGTGGGEYGAYGAYGGYGGYGGYSSRRIQVYGWAEETTPGGEFNVYFRVELIDEIESNFVDTEITLNCGHATPAETPDDLEILEPIGDYFTVDTYTYQFQERVAPEIAVHADWNSDI